MDTQRLILFVIFSLSLFMLWTEWEKQNQPPVPVTQTTPPGQAVNDIPSAATKPAPTQQADNTPEVNIATGKRVQVKTDVVDAEIDLNGGDLRRYVLLKHGEQENKNKSFVLLEDKAPHFYVAQSGLIGNGLPTHKETYTATAEQYTLAPGKDNLEVKLSWQGANGVTVQKIYSFQRGSYVIKIRHEIQNASSEKINADAYYQLLRDGTPPAGHSALLPTYTGPAVYTEQKKFVKHDFADIGKDKSKDVILSQDGWVAILQHYFLTALVPEVKTQREFYFKKLNDNLYASGVITPVGEIEPNSSKSISMTLYAGPQEQHALSKLAPGLDLSIDYGMLTIIAKPIFWLLNFIHGYVGNWGWAIILLTIIIKLGFYPLSAASYRSMGKMKALAPRLQKLKEQYGDDRQKMHQAMMDIYKTEKINPLGGCLPVLIQIPVFIALYWVLLYSVEIRHAPFALWIQDLTAQDPYYVLPVLMGISMFVQTKLNPTPPDPMQAKIMTIMPIAFSIMFFWFPAGLVLYWVVNNVLSILQQWRINVVMAHDTKKAKR